jgi:hypothetical protein
MLPLYQEVDDKLKKKRPGKLGGARALLLVAVLLVLSTVFIYFFHFTERSSITKPTLTHEDNNSVLHPAKAIKTTEPISISSSSESSSSSSSESSTQSTTTTTTTTPTTTPTQTPTTSSTSATPAKPECGAVAIGDLPLSTRWVCQREEVVAAFKHSWGGYEAVAFGQDELQPISNRANPKAFLGLGMTVIDAMDLLWLIIKTTDHPELKPSWDRCLDFVKNSLDFTKDTYVSLFETTIRILGGLLAAYDLSGEPILLEKVRHYDQ